LGIAIRPSTSTGEETVAEKFWPVEEVLEPTGSSRTTEIAVSAGITRGRRATASREDLPELDPAMEPFGESAEELFAAESEAD
jgi:hypothetical protein